MADVSLRALVELGLTPSEANVYLALLGNGPSTPSQVAERTDLYRPNVYDALKRLQARGLASRVKLDSGFSYAAAPLDALESLVERKRESLMAALPNLNALAAQAGSKTSVQVLEGKNALRAVIRDACRTLERTPSNPLALGVDERQFVQADEIALGQYFAFLKRKRLQERVLIREGDSFTPGNPTSTYRTLPAKYFNAQPALVYGDGVALLVFSDPTLAILIHNAALADSYRKQFELAWSVSKPVRGSFNRPRR